jgi:hypothetical protein
MALAESRIPEGLNLLHTHGARSESSNHRAFESL